jgi:lysyl-tRNA synthetase class 2
VPGIPSHRVSGSRAERLTYAEAFQRHIGIDPHTATADALAGRAQSLIGAAAPDLGEDRDGWLDLLLSHVIEPELGRTGPTFVYDYPASQAALARIRPGDPAVAERFETWFEGIELANGYHELTDPAEQRRRFDADLAARRERGLPEVPVDHRLLNALEAGLPQCAGVALGVDRLVMLAAGADRIDEVIAFPVDRA